MALADTEAAAIGRGGECGGRRAGAGEIDGVGGEFSGGEGAGGEGGEGGGGEDVGKIFGGEGDGG
eukprot:4787127-Prymnesium_polylepis.1